MLRLFMKKGRVKMSKRRLAVIFVLLAIVVISILGISILRNKRDAFIRQQLIQEAVEGTNWPIEDVPLIGKKGLTVANFGDYTCEATIPSGVSYEDIRKYLIQLYHIGFRPDSDYGSENPNYLNSARNATHINEITWIAQKDNYYVTVLWGREGALDEFELPYEYNFDVNLFIKPGNVNKQEEQVQSGDLLGESGEIDGE